MTYGRSCSGSRVEHFGVCHAIRIHANNSGKYIDAQQLDPAGSTNWSLNVSELINIQYMYIYIFLWGVQREQRVQDRGRT